MKIKKEDKALIAAYCKWASKKASWPREYEMSRLIDNMNTDHRYLIDDFLSELRLKQYNNEL